MTEIIIQTCEICKREYAGSKFCPYCEDSYKYQAANWEESTWESPW